MVVQIQANQPLPNDADILDWLNFDDEVEPIHVHVLRNWQVLEPHTPRCYSSTGNAEWDIDGRSVRVTGSADIEGEGWRTRELGEWPPHILRRQKYKNYDLPDGQIVFLDPDTERVGVACDWADDFVMAVFDARTGRLIQIRDFRGFLTEGAVGRSTLDDFVDPRFEFSWLTDSGGTDVALWICGLGLLLVRFDGLGGNFVRAGHLSVWEFDSDLNFLGATDREVPSSNLVRIGVIHGGLVLLWEEGDAHYILLDEVE